MAGRATAASHLARRRTPMQRGRSPRSRPRRASVRRSRRSMTGRGMRCCRRTRPRARRRGGPGALPQGKGGALIVKMHGVCILQAEQGAARSSKEQQGAARSSKASLLDGWLSLLTEYTVGQTSGKSILYCRYPNTNRSIFPTLFWNKCGN